jgi:hypothetical protein
MSYQRDEQDDYAMEECCVPESLQMCAMKDEEENISYKMAKEDRFDDFKYDAMNYQEMMAP